MSYPMPCHVRYPILRAAREIHAALGPGLARSVYADALEARFPDGKHRMERDVLLPSVKEDGKTIAAYFTFLYRKILVRGVSYPDPLWPDTEGALLRRLFAAGLPLGVVLNFGRDELEVLCVTNHKGMAALKSECAQRRAFKAAGKARLAPEETNAEARTA